MSPFDNLDNTVLIYSTFAQQTQETEYHLIIRVRNKFLSFAEQLTAIETSLRNFLKKNLQAKVVFERWFVSDAANQQQTILAPRRGCNHAISVIQQPPLDGSKVALLVVLSTGVQTGVAKECDGLYEVRHQGFTKYWTTLNTLAAKDTRFQTSQLLIDYVEKLSSVGCTLADNCMRTWFFVRDIDINYSDFSAARNQLFTSQGLTPATHFIASTGIEGRTNNSNTLISFDAFAIKGLNPENITYLSAPENFNPTSEYGVSFERGTKIDFPDRTHILISGTASINNKGEVVHPGNVILQTRQMIENVEALLSEAGAGRNDIQHIIVYLRDVSDYAAVTQIIGEKFYRVPYLITLAPVCRPGWLVEMECVAAKLR